MRLLLVFLCAFGALAGSLRAQAKDEPPTSGVTSAFAERNAVKVEADATPVDDRPSRPIKRAAKPTRDGDQPSRAPLLNGMPEVRTVVASLALVLSLFFVVAWMMKKNMPKSAGILPREVVQVLGRSQLSGKQFVHLVRCGNKLLLVSITPGGAETLTEITDPLEVDRIAGLCAQRNPQSATAAFQDVLQQLSRERSHG